METFWQLCSGSLFASLLRVKKEEEAKKKNKNNNKKNYNNNSNKTICNDRIII